MAMQEEEEDEKQEFMWCVHDIPSKILHRWHT
ncbi:uncharacterized protein G2W53_039021 [Senna tora]|uniref:Uncharacterized protein n=1 Tax=Senna tora TaxID=362788 RepID=A0A834SLV2_9FABA|nr:uncharacterized protein G2W53_039021 [Senna tora]